MMRKWMMMPGVLVAGLLLAGIALAAPHTHSIDWWVIDGGSVGGTVSGGTGGTASSVSLGGALGQAVVGRDTSGTSELCSGFWCGVGGSGVHPIVDEHRVYLPLALNNSP